MTINAELNGSKYEFPDSWSDEQITDFITKDQAALSNGQDATSQTGVGTPTPSTQAPTPAPTPSASTPTPDLYSAAFLPKPVQVDISAPSTATPESSVLTPVLQNNTINIPDVETKPTTRDTQVPQALSMQYGINNTNLNALRQQLVNAKMAEHPSLTPDEAQQQVAKEQKRSVAEAAVNSLTTPVMGVFGPLADVAIGAGSAAASNVAGQATTGKPIDLGETATQTVIGGAIPAGLWGIGKGVSTLFDRTSPEALTSLSQNVNKVNEASNKVEELADTYKYAKGKFDDLTTQPKMIEDENGNVIPDPSGTREPAVSNGRTYDEYSNLRDNLNTAMDSGDEEAINSAKQDLYAFQNDAGKPITKNFKNAYDLYSDTVKEGPGEIYQAAQEHNALVEKFGFKKNNVKDELGRYNTNLPDWSGKVNTFEGINTAGGNTGVGNVLKSMNTPEELTSLGIKPTGTETAMPKMPPLLKDIGLSEYGLEARNATAAEKSIQDLGNEADELKAIKSVGDAGNKFKEFRDDIITRVIDNIKRGKFNEANEAYKEIRKMKKDMLDSGIHFKDVNKLLKLNTKANEIGNYAKEAFKANKETDRGGLLRVATLIGSGLLGHGITLPAAEATGKYIGGKIIASQAKRNLSDVASALRGEYVQSPLSKTFETTNSAIANSYPFARSVGNASPNIIGQNRSSNSENARLNAAKYDYQASLPQTASEEDAARMYGSPSRAPGSASNAFPASPATLSSTSSTNAPASSRMPSVKGISYDAEGHPQFTDEVNSITRGLAYAETTPGNGSRWVFTRGGNGSSSAYGPLQLTETTANDYLTRHPSLFSEDERAFLTDFVEQGKRMLDNVRNKKGIKKYELGGSGDLGNANTEQKYLYMDVCRKIINDIYNRHNGNVAAVVKEWYPNADKKYFNLVAKGM